MAPEVIMSEPYDASCDVYSFGILCSELVTRRPPFEELTPIQLIAQVTHRGLRPGLGSPAADSPLRSLIERCWARDPKVRPQFKDALEFIEAIDPAEWLGDGAA